MFFFFSIWFLWWLQWGDSGKKNFNDLSTFSKIINLLWLQFQLDFSFSLKQRSTETMQIYFLWFCFGKLKISLLLRMKSFSKYHLFYSNNFGKFDHKNVQNSIWRTTYSNAFEEQILQQMVWNISWDFSFQRNEENLNYSHEVIAFMSANFSSSALLRSTPNRFNQLDLYIEQKSCHF